MHTSFPARAPRRRAILPVVVAAALTLAACGDNDDAAPTDTAPSSETTERPPGTTEPSSESTESSSESTERPGDVIANCDVDVAAGHPDRILTMNQGATEIALALGFGDQMFGTAYLDDAILPELADEYEAIPVISDEYPSTEALFDLEPDFVYASYPSAFGPDVAGDRVALADLGVGSYLSPAACPERADTDEALTFDLVFQEYTDVATLFGDRAAGDALVAEQQAMLDESHSADFEDTTVFWWDGGLDAPTAGACCGAPGMIMDAVGVTNVFGDVDGSWAEVGWESVVSADPDVIVLIDASWDPAADKQAHLESDPALSNLTAVRNQSYVVVPFSASTPGVRNAAVVGEIAELITELDPTS